MPFKVEHWDMWLSNPNYERFRKQLDLRYEQDESFRSNFLFSANEFLERYLNNSQENTVINKQHALQCCLEYLKEECTIIMPLWANMGYQIIVYPSNMLHAMKATHETLVLPHQYMHWLTLRFERKKIIEPEMV